MLIPDRYRCEANQMSKSNKKLVYTTPKGLRGGCDLFLGMLLHTKGGFMDDGNTKPRERGGSKKAIRLDPNHDD